MNSQRETVFKRCGCTDPVSGRQLAARCPHLPESDHGSWYYALQVTTVGGRRARQRHGGYPTRDAADYRAAEDEERFVDVVTDLPADA